MKEKIKKILRKIMIKCVFNHVCDFIMMCMAYVYPENTIAIHILMQNPYSMMFLHFFDINQTKRNKKYGN